MTWMLFVLSAFAAELGPVTVPYECAMAYGTDQQPVPKIAAGFNVEFPLHIVPESAREAELNWLTGNPDNFAPHTISSVEFEGRIEAFVLPYYKELNDKTDDFAGLEITIRQRYHGVVESELSRRLPRTKGAMTLDFIAWNHRLRAIQVSCREPVLATNKAVIGVR